MSFWRIVHNLIRHSDTTTEVQRSTEACVWMAENITNLRRVCSAQQIELLARIHTFWFTHKSSPSLQILKETIERKSATPGILELITEYEEQEGLTIISVRDLGQLLTDLVEEWQAERLRNVLKITRTINNGVWKDEKDKKEYSGPTDAARYLLKQVEAGMVFTHTGSSSGVLNDSSDEIAEIYDKAKADQSAGLLKIKTGVAEVDALIAVKRGDLVGVLGYAGQRKTTFCRTMAYNAVRSGFNVLHVTLEQTYNEERCTYAIIHSADPKFAKYGFRLSKRRFDNGELTDAEEKFLKEVVLPDLSNLPGRLIIRQPTEGTSWASIKTLAEITDQTTPIDLFYVDYLTMVSTTSTRDSKAEMEMNIKDAKQTALQFGGGRGVVFLTPVQGNRKGWEEAKNTGGIWDMTGVYEYSEFDKSSDLILSVFTDEALLQESAIIISSAKTRRSAPLGAIKTLLDVDRGFIGAFNNSHHTASEILTSFNEGAE